MDKLEQLFEEEIGEELDSFEIFKKGFIAATKQLRPYHICINNDRFKVVDYGTLVCSMCKSSDSINFYTTKEEADKLFYLIKYLYKK